MFRLILFFSFFKINEMFKFKHFVDANHKYRQKILKSELKENTHEIPEAIETINKIVVSRTKDALIQFYGNRTIARFYALETIARVPYFSYTSVLHLYETIGLFRQKEFIKLHFSESWVILILEFVKLKYFNS